MQNPLYTESSVYVKSTVYRIGYICRILPRRSSSLTFTLDESSVVVADKSGDAYRYSLTDTEAEGTLLAGHISMLLDVVSICI